MPTCQKKKRRRGRPHVYPPTVILRCFVVRIWLRLDSNRALHDFLAMDYYPYNRKILKACGLTSLPDRRTFDRRLANISTGKSPVAIAVALSLGSSYVCTSTKDLQTQYSKDFAHLKVAKGKSNFPCLVKEDFIRNSIYKCGICASSHVNECYHTTVEYGPCMTDESLEGIGCKYRTFAKDYRINNLGTKEEQIFIDSNAKKHYQKAI